MGLLDIIFGWFFFTQTLTWLFTIPRRGVCVFFLLRILAPKWSYLIKKVISGPEFLKNDDICSDLIKLDQIGSSAI